MTFGLNALVLMALVAYLGTFLLKARGASAPVLASAPMETAEVS